MQHFTLYKYPNQYASFPHITLDSQGDLLAVFRAAGAQTAQAALTGTHTHQDIDARIRFMRSSDGGEIWSASTVITQGDSTTGITPSDPALTVLRDGRLLVRFARWRLVPIAQRGALGQIHRHFVRTGQVGEMVGNGFAVSEDGGQIWRTLGTTATGTASRESAIELADGSLILALYQGYPAFNEHALLSRSWDGGQTWGDQTAIAGRPIHDGYRTHANYNETSLALLDETTLLALLRVDHAFVTDDDSAEFMSEGGIGELEWTISYDVGLTWDAPRKTGIWGQPAHLLRLHDGTFLATYGYRRQPYGVRARRVKFTSPNHWENGPEIVLRDDGAGWDVGYPASVQLSTGEIFSAYYLHGEDGVRYVAGTRWRLP